MKLWRAIDLVLLLCLFANEVVAGTGRNNLSVCFDLANACDDWQAGFADYPAGQESFFELAAQCADSSTNANRGVFLSGANHSDDLFMFIKHPVSGLKPAKNYFVEASIEILSKAPTNCIGVGGDPGMSVYVKFGASTVEPVPVIQTNGYVRMNVDIGSQSNSGSNAVVIGNIATTSTNCFNEHYELKRLQSPAPLAAQSDADGTLWIFAGADSGFEGRTSLFFTQANIRIRPAHADEDENSNNDNDSPRRDHQHL